MQEPATSNPAGFHYHGSLVLQELPLRLPPSSPPIDGGKQSWSKRNKIKNRPVHRGQLTGLELHLQGDFYASLDLLQLWTSRELATAQGGVPTAWG